MTGQKGRLYLWLGQKLLVCVATAVNRASFKGIASTQSYLRTRMRKQALGMHSLPFEASKIRGSFPLPISEESTSPHSYPV